MQWVHWNSDVWRFIRDVGASTLHVHQYTGTIALFNWHTHTMKLRPRVCVLDLALRRREMRRAAFARHARMLSRFLPAGPIYEIYAYY
jgi:hypothetical protein